MRSFYPLCLFLALTSLARANRSLAARALARLIRQSGGGGGWSCSNGASVSANAASLDASKDANDEQLNTLRSNPPHSDPTSFPIGLGTSGSLPWRFTRRIFSKLFDAVPISRCIAFGAQLATAYYLSKLVKEVWQDVNEEFVTARGEGGRDVREEHDMPYADEGAFSGDLGEDIREESDSSDSGEDNNLRPPPKRRRPLQNDGLPTPQMTAIRELGAKLAASGIPFASEVSADNAHNSPTVERILRSLTRAEGSILAQTLLDGNLESPASTAAAWNAIGGLSDAKESLLDLAFPMLSSQSNSENQSDYGGLLANPPGQCPQNATQ